VTFPEVPEQFIRRVVKYGLKAELLDGFPGMELAFTTARSNYERLINEAGGVMSPSRQVSMNPDYRRDINNGRDDFNYER
jgi:hypothetical protein